MTDQNQDPRLDPRADPRPGAPIHHRRHQTRTREYLHARTMGLNEQCLLDHLENLRKERNLPILRIQLLLSIPRTFPGSATTMTENNTLLLLKSLERKGVLRLNEHGDLVDLDPDTTHEALTWHRTKNTNPREPGNYLVRQDEEEEEDRRLQAHDGQAWVGKEPLAWAEKRRPRRPLPGPNQTEEKSKEGGEKLKVARGSQKKRGHR